MWHIMHAGGPGCSRTNRFSPPFEEAGFLPASELGASDGTTTRAGVIDLGGSQLGCSSWPSDEAVVPATALSADVVPPTSVGAARLGEASSSASLGSIHSLVSRRLRVAFASSSKYLHPDDSPVGHVHQPKLHQPKRRKAICVVGKRRVARFKMASIETLAQARSIRAREERAEYCIPVPTGTGTDTGTGTAPSSIKFKPTRLYILE